MAEFLPILKTTLKHEAGYVNDPDDRGGETYKGIARNMHLNWSGWTIIDVYSKENKTQLTFNLNKNERLSQLVEKFYKCNFWDKLLLDEIKSQSVAAKLFDIAVNQGVGTAAKYFQDILNMLNNNGKHYSNIAVDGGVGKKTLHAYKCYMDTSKKFSYRSEENNALVLLKCLAGEQYARYEKIVKRNEVQEKYFYGWILNRV